MSTSVPRFCTQCGGELEHFKLIIGDNEFCSTLCYSIWTFNEEKKKNVTQNSDSG